MSEPTSYHMTPDEFRRYGRALVDWIADYYERVESLPVLARVKPGQVRSQLPPAPPQQGEEFEDILADVDRILMPGVTLWQSPNLSSSSAAASTSRSSPRTSWSPRSIAGPSVLTAGRSARRP